MTSDRPQFLLVGNGSYLNRGCEAIVRGTVKILRYAFGNPMFINANFDACNPPLVPKENDTDIIHRPIGLPKRWSAEWTAGQVLKRISPALGRRFYFDSLKDHLVESKAVLSIGGDNYALNYAYAVPRLLLNLDKYILKHNKPFIIWGASIGPFDRRPDFARVIHHHFRNEVTAIFVREKKSQDYFAKYRITDNVFLMSDPAFLLDAESVTDGRLGFLIPDGAIGLNLSPLMAKFVTSGDLKAWVLKSVRILQHMRRQFARPIVLIPNDTRAATNDWQFMREVLGELGSDRSDIYLLPDNLSAAEIKWVISKMSCLIAARTHATIAAFSTAVPTVSLAYSVKAWGINESVFGHTEFVVRPEDVLPERILEKTKMVLREASQIRKTLESNIQDIRNLALDAGLTLKKLLEN